MTQTPGWQRKGLTAGALALVWLAVVVPTRAEDVTTLSGTTYRQVRTVRVEPDGVVWQHATGQCKVDFADLPESVRKAYHYDPKQATVYQTAQAQVREQTAAQAQQNQQTAAAWRTRRVQELMAANAEPGTFSLHRNPSSEPAVQSLGETIERKEAARDLLKEGDGTIWDRRLWAIPSFLLGGYSPGDHFDPHFDLNSHEYQATLHHGPGAFAVDAAHDGFFRPEYLTKSYYQDVERAEAFARGRP